MAAHDVGDGDMNDTLALYLRYACTKRPHANAVPHPSLMIHDAVSRHKWSLADFRKCCRRVDRSKIIAFES